MLLRVVFLMSVLFILVYPQKDVSEIKQTESSNTQVRPFTDLTYEITAPSQSVLPLQPIPIIIKQKNMTNEQVLGYKGIGFNNMPIYLHIQKSGGNQKSVMGQFSQLSKFVSYTNVEIPPNSVSEAKEWIMLGLNQYFSEPGTYEIKAVILNDDRTQSVESNTVSIEIQQPIGNDRTAYNLIKNSSFQEYLFSGDNFDKIKNTLETIIVKFPNSSYVRNASFVLGERHFVRKQYARALTYLLKLEYDDEFIFREKVKDYLAEIRRQAPGQQVKEENE